MKTLIKFKTNTGIGLFDLETSYMLLADFSLKNQGYIPKDNIVQEWNIYCGAFKYLDSPKIYRFSVDPSDPTNDYNVVKELRELLVDTKLLIGHNLDKFDMKKFNTRLIKHGLAPINHKILTLDTLKAAKKHFAFTSNRLDYIGQFLGVGNKLQHREGNPWLKLIKGQDVKETLKHMEEYCVADVYPLLQNVYLKLRPYIDHPMLGGKVEKDGQIHCQHCGSTDMQSRGDYTTKAGAAYDRYQCKNRQCMGWTNVKTKDEKTES